MYSSALFYPMEIVPVTVQKIFTLNPIYSPILTFRGCVYGTVPDFSVISYLAAFSLMTLGIGIILFNIYNKKLALEL